MKTIKEDYGLCGIFLRTGLSGICYRNNGMYESYCLNGLTGIGYRINGNFECCILLLLCWHSEPMGRILTEGIAGINEDL